MSKLAPETAEEIRRALRGEPEWRVELTLADFAAWESGLRDTKIEWAKVEPPRPGEFPALDALPAEERAALTRRGLDLLRAGRVGVLVLNAGLATGFGQTPGRYSAKGAVIVREGVTYWENKMRDGVAVQRLWGARLPVIEMRSFATRADMADEEARVRRLLGADMPELWVIEQPATVRGDVRAGGHIAPAVRSFDGAYDLAVGGHGDAHEVFRRHCLDRALSRGLQYFMLSNIDNLGATFDPLLLGYHACCEEAARRGGKSYWITMEEAAKREGDKGGTLARIDGRLQLLEENRVPRDAVTLFASADHFPGFNTNTFVLSIDVFRTPVALPVMLGEKEVPGEDHPFIVFERVFGELLGPLSGGAVRVDRERRFQPGKSPCDLLIQRTTLYERDEFGRIVPRDASRPQPRFLFVRTANGPRTSKPCVRGLCSLQELEEHVADGGSSLDLRELEEIRFQGEGSIHIERNVALRGKIEVRYGSPDSVLRIRAGARVGSPGGMTDITVPAGQSAVLD